MPNVEWNGWYGGISEDDFVVPANQYIEGSNVTGLRTGYGLTLGPKTNKQLLTGSSKVGTMFDPDFVGLDNVAVGTDGGHIYKLDGTDSTPIHTLASGGDIRSGIYNDIAFFSYYYFFAEDGGTLYRIARITLDDWTASDFSSMDENLFSFNNFHTPPVIIWQDHMYIGTSNGIFRLDSLDTRVNFSVSNGNDVVGITIHGNRLFLYTDIGELIVWDGFATSVDATIDLGFVPERITSEGSIDHVISRTGDYYIVSGYTPTLVNQSKRSNRLNDNSQFIKKIDFTADRQNGIMISTIKGGAFMISNETVPGIYRNESLIRGLQPGLHKSITKDNTGVSFDQISTIHTVPSTNNNVYYGFQSGTTTFGIDYIDLDSDDTCIDGYVVTNIFRGPPNKVNKIKEIRITTSNTDGDNSVILSKRINNGAWEIVRTINNSTSTIDRLRIFDQTDEFIDIQFKLELHNDSGGENPPIIQNLELIYNINKE